MFRIADEFGNLRRWSTAAITFAVDGPGELIGDNPFSLIGAGAVWLRAGRQAGLVRLRATHPTLGVCTVEIRVVAAAPDHGHSRLQGPIG